MFDVDSMLILFVNRLKVTIDPIAHQVRMVKTFHAYLPDECHRTYSCIHCRAHLANHDELISKVLPFKVFFCSELPCV